jgi:hydroxyacylglutathione hydrolase
MGTACGHYEAQIVCISGLGWISRLLIVVNGMSKGGLLMTLVLERMYSEGIAQLSYLVGDDSVGQVAVIDPRRDVDIYLNRARDLGVRVTHIIETHIHADFVSGSRELQARTGAPIYGGKSTDYRFELEQLSEGDELRIGSVTLCAVHTPGHTPEHISLLLLDAKQGQEPFGVFTGDTLFNLDVGRPDLLGNDREKELAVQLHHSLFDKLLPLGDRTEVYPGHGAGSACGKSIGDRRQSTFGNEKLFNPALQERTEEEFVTWLLEGMPEPPSYYAHLKQLNAQGAPIRGGVPMVPPVSADEFQQQMQDEQTVVIDARSILAFAGGHIPAAINIALGPNFSTWVGWVIDPAKTLVLVLDSERDVFLAAQHLFGIGYDNLAGYLHKGMTTWQNAALPLERTGVWTVHELNERKSNPGVTVLDVRSDAEWQAGRVPEAQHIYVPHLEEQLDTLDRNQKIVTYCGSGYRSSIAASLLRKQGFSDVVNVPGAWTAWTAAGYEVAKP